MALSVGEQLARIREEAEWLRDNRYVDFAFRFVDYKKSDEGPVPTGIESEVYGGVYDTRRKLWLPDATPDEVIEITVWGKQLPFIEYEGNAIFQGGRGTGKSYATACRILRRLVKYDIQSNLLLSADYNTTKAVLKFLTGGLPDDPSDRQILPDRCIRKFIWEVNGSRKFVQLAIPAIIRVVSGTTLHKARSLTAGQGHVDEVQIVNPQTMAAFVGSIRGHEHSAVSYSGTLSPRMLELLEQREARGLADSVFEASPLDNPWLSETDHRNRREEMDETSYRIEILNDRQFLEQGLDEEYPRCLPAFDERHEINVNHIPWADITTSYCARYAPGRRIKQAVGFDPNNMWPNYATVFRIYDPSRPRLVAIDQLLVLGNAGHMVEQLRRRGYLPQETMIADDRSGIEIGTYTSSGALSPRKHLTKAGYSIINEKVRKNPGVSDSMECLDTLVSPPDGGEPRFFVSNALRGEKLYNLGKGRFFSGLIDDILDYRWKQDGTLLKRARDRTHGPDTCRYVAHELFPVRGRAPQPTVIMTADGRRVQL